MNLKIQILVGNTLMSRFHVDFKIELPLVAASLILTYAGSIPFLISHFNSAAVYHTMLHKMVIMQVLFMFIFDEFMISFFCTFFFYQRILETAVLW